MRKWRPTYKCLYVVPEIHGAYDSLKIILNRIIPLRFSANQEDQVIFLGDYIDRGGKSFEVIEELIQLHKNNNILCLKGNHELLFLKALQSQDNYRNWLLHGGIQTVKSYIENSGLRSNPEELPFSRLSDIIPESHINFIKSLPAYGKIDDYILFHGGFDFKQPVESINEEIIVSDMAGSRSFKCDYKNISLDSNHVYIGAHNYKSKLPFIHPKYFMLGGGAPEKLILFELNSMTCAMIKHGKSRIYKHNFKFVE